LTPAAIRPYFKEYGITITNIGHAEGLIYDDPVIQTAINNNNVAEMDVKKAEQEYLAQKKRNETLVEKATAERKAAEEFAKAQDAQVAKIRLEIERTKAEALLTAAGKWQGQMPNSVLPQGSNLLFGLDSSPANK
jgi:hypothetical protein